MSVDERRIVDWLIQVGDDFPWTGLDIAQAIIAGCEPWPEELRRDPAELAELRRQLAERVTP